MAGGGAAQERLDQIVKLIAAEMVAEVCSVYVMRAGEVLELFATEGLKPEAVHKTRLRGRRRPGRRHRRPRAAAGAGRRAVPSRFRLPPGNRRRDLPLADGRADPARRPGARRARGAEPHAAPIHRGRDRDAADVAMVLAELVASGELVSAATSWRRPTASALAAGAARRASRLNPGLAHRPGRAARAARHDPADGRRGSRGRARAAAPTRVAACSSAIDEHAGVERHRRPAASIATILETYRMFAEDRGWLGRIAEAVRSGLTAEAAVQKVAGRHPRPHDAGHRPLSARAPRTISRTSPTGCSAICWATARAGARRPAGRVRSWSRAAWGRPSCWTTTAAGSRALVLEEGSPTAPCRDRRARARHSGASAACRGSDAAGRATATPLVDRRRPRHRVRSGRATTSSRRVRRARCGRARERERLLRPLRELPAVTRDGIAIELYINAGLLIDLPQLARDRRRRASGSTAPRSRSWSRTTIPTSPRRPRSTASVLDQRRRPAGGVPHARHRRRQGAALPGAARRRRIRRWAGAPSASALDRPAMLRQQLRALLRAGGGRAALRHVPDDRRGRRVRSLPARLLDLELRARRGGGQAAADARSGSAPCSKCRRCCGSCRQLLQRVDFLSVGTNDLAQFLFAGDRGNPRLADRYDTLSPPMLALFLARWSRACGDAGRAAQPVRRDGGRAARGDGADRRSAFARCRWRRPRSARSRR